MSSTPTEKGSSTKSFPKDYRLHIRLVPDPSSMEKSDWLVHIDFNCRGLLQIMREGLSWTTSNVIPEGGFICEALYFRYKRVYELREVPDKPASESRWTATATVYADSVQALSDFRLTTLSRRHLLQSYALNKDKNAVFSFINESLPGDEPSNYNCFIDILHPKYGSWWFWPIEEITDCEKKARGSLTPRQRQRQRHGA
ncbi:hypothetical protein GE09DRAFT_206141 [Coniochaeta sp. 2T2.1]|nr:hypothetical protein GE09DRAFT_206141 [Coniochaeta sp. 2T2.1]